MKKVKGISRMGALVMGTAFVCSIAAYISYAPNAYEIFINGSAVACVKDVSTANKLTDKIFSEIHNRFKDLNINEEIVYTGIIAENGAINNPENIKKNILNVLNTRVKAVEMDVDGARAAILANKSEGDRVISMVGSYYIDKLNLSGKKLISVKNSIKYYPVEVYLSQVDDIEEAAEKLINNNSKGAAPGLKVEYSGIKKEKQNIEFEKKIELSEELSPNASKILTKGQDGEREIESCISYINGEIKGSNVISEKITKQPQVEVVLKGKGSTMPSAVGMTVPSRGNISSSFGMRWGRMHEGIDIAAKQGEPIYAAMDGRVTYSGWIEGYGYAVKLQHENNMETLYGHCSKLVASVGDTVKKGQLIANVGSTGNSTGPHLHFEVRIDGKAVNPYPYIYKK